MEHPDQIRAMRNAATAAPESASATSVEARWAALHENAQEIGRFAALADEPLSDQLASFPERLAAAEVSTRELARQGLEDIDAMLQPGLAALRAIHARGHEPTAPALALWREFHSARQALLTLCQAQ